MQYALIYQFQAGISIEDTIWRSIPTENTHTQTGLTTIFQVNAISCFHRNFLSSLALNCASSCNKPKVHILF